MLDDDFAGSMSKYQSHSRRFKKMGDKRKKLYSILQLRIKFYEEIYT